MGPQKLVVSVLLALAVSSVSGSTVEFASLVQMHATGRLTTEEFEEKAKATFLDESHAEAAAEDPGVPGVLARLGLSELAPIFSQQKIITKHDLLLLTEHQMITYLGMTDLGPRLKLLEYQQQQRRSASSTLDRVKMAELFASLLSDHDKRTQDTAALIRDNIGKLEEKLRAEVRAMVVEATQAQATGALAQTGQPPRLLQETNPEVASNLEGAAMWFEQDGATLCFGADAATKLGRLAGDDNVLSASTAFQIGSADDLGCTDTTKGTLRSLTEAGKTTLEVCNGAKPVKILQNTVID